MKDIVLIKGALVVEMYAVRILRSQPLRLGLTIGGVALCIVLMLFLLSIYRGVADGSVDYIRQNRVDFWVLQRNATNILRGSSWIPSGQGEKIRRVPSVKSAVPVLFLLSTIKKEDQSRTVFLTGFEPKEEIGGPPRLASGRSVLGDDEIVLDRSFAAKFGYRLGDRVNIQDADLRVVGLSEGTNAFVIQYAFVTLNFAQRLIGLPGIATCYLLNVGRRGAEQHVAEELRLMLPGLEIYDHETFLKNNIQEMKSGFLPLLYTVAAIGAVVLTVILSLLLSVNILERRKDFAVLKTLGSPRGFLWSIIIEQALLIAAAASLVALAIFFPLVRAIEQISPEVQTKSSLFQIVIVVFVVGIMSLLSSFISIQRLRRIYLLEAFA